MYRKLIGDNLNHQVPPLYIVLTQIVTIDTQRVHNEYTTAVERFNTEIDTITDAAEAMIDKALCMVAEG